MLDASNPEIRNFFSEADALRPTEAEVSHVVQLVARWRTERRALRRRRMIVTLALALAVFGSAFAYPTTRDALDTFFSGGAIPGGQKDLGGLPGWLDNTARTRPATGTPRLLAEQDGQKLYAYRDANSGRACLAFANDSDTCSSNDEWQRLFAGHALLKLASGVGPTADSKVAVFGLARSSVTHVALLDGQKTVARAPVSNGGWVLVADQGQHDTLVGLDANGKTVESLDARGWTWTFCLRESGCP